MKSIKLAAVAGVLLSLITTAVSFAQIETRYYAPESTKQMDMLHAQNSVPTVQVDLGDLTKRKQEDEIRQKNGKPFRFAIALPVNLTLSNGSWTKVEHMNVWHLAIKSDKALSLSLIFENLYLADSAKLYVYNADQTIIIGPITNEHTKKGGYFATDIIEGNQIILELQESDKVKQRSQIRLSKVVHGYKELSVGNNLNQDFNTTDSDSSKTNISINSLTKEHVVPTSSNGSVTTNGLNDSNSCNLDLARSDGSTRGWGEQANGVALILRNDNTELCTGCLVNNTRQDRIL